MPLSSVPMTGDVEVPPGDPEWHPLASDWYASLAVSGQTRWYEPSDWAAARFVAEVMSRGLRSKYFSPPLFSAIWSAMGDLLTTEASRRRVRVEVDRRQATPDLVPEQTVERWRRELGAL